MAMWQRLKPIKLEQFHYYWRIVEPLHNGKPLTPTTDVLNAEFVEWNAVFSNFGGMRHRKYECAHGILRCVNGKGDIYEYTAKKGKSHGLYRWITENGVVIALCREGKFEAMLSFDHRFFIMKRKDNRQIFAKMDPMDWMIGKK